RATPERARRSARPRAPSAVLRWVAATSTRSRKKGTSRRTRLACRTRGTRCAEFSLRGRTYTLGGGQRADQRGPDDRFAEDDVGARLAGLADEGLVVTGNDDAAGPPPRAREPPPNHHIAGDIGQAEVGENHVEIPRGGQFCGFPTARRRDHVHAFGAEQQCKDFANIR